MSIPKQLNGNMADHFDQIIQKIRRGEHFGLIRPNDGEHLVMENNTFTVQPGDDWTNTADGILRLQLIDAVKTVRPDLYIGIPCENCFKECRNSYLNKYSVNPAQITYANIFCNSNWKKTVQFLHSYSPGFYLITCGTKECNFPIKDRLIIDKYLVNNWNNVWEDETQRVLDYVKDTRDELICFAAGPLTKVWIPKCMELNPYNVYLDVGSSLDFFTKENLVPRPYTYANSKYAQLVCQGN
jgi:hypothetical protein